MEEQGSKFELSAQVERDIERLSHEIKEVAKKPEFRERGAREVVKESLKTFHPTPTAANKQTDDSPLPAYMKDEGAETKIEVEKLIGLSLRDGFAAGIAEAKKRGAFFLDAFHDGLTEKIMPELEERGLVHR